MLLWRACAADLGRLGGLALVSGLWAVGRAVVVVVGFAAEVAVVVVAVVVGHWSLALALFGGHVAVGVVVVAGLV